MQRAGIVVAPDYTRSNKKSGESHGFPRFDHLAATRTTFWNNARVIKQLRV